jgi:hypothetical protein
LILSNSESVLAHALKLIEPKQNTVEPVALIPKTQVVKCYVDQPGTDRDNGAANGGGNKLTGLATSQSTWTNQPTRYGYN